MARTRSDSPPLFSLPQRPDFSIEKRLMRDGQAPVVGLDEAGRGPLAGPVVAAAVILDPNDIPKGLDDSKRLSAEERERLFAAIVATSVGVSVSSVCATTIDGINILRASLEAMRRAVDGLSVMPRYALADGRDIPPGLPCAAQALVKGDQRSQSIAAASIVAKVTRDRIMTRMASHKPDYGFESHVGYATKRHREAIVQFGPVQRVHRMTFAPLRLQVETIIETEIELRFGS